MEWKTTDGDYGNTQFVNSDVFFEGLFEKERFLDVLKNFICFNVDRQNTFKILAGYHQYFAVKKAVASTRRATIVVITDRNDLDDQLYGQFARCKDFLRQTPQHAESRQHLAELLAGRQANDIIFTTMQKFEESGTADRYKLMIETYTIPASGKSS